MSSELLADLYKLVINLSRLLHLPSTCIQNHVHCVQLYGICILVIHFLAGLSVQDYHFNLTYFACSWIEDRLECSPPSQTMLMKLRIGNLWHLVNLLLLAIGTHLECCFTFHSWTWTEGKYISFCCGYTTSRTWRGSPNHWGECGFFKKVLSSNL